MPRSGPAAILWWFCICVSWSNVVFGAQQGTERNGPQASAVFSINPTTQLRKGLDVWPKIAATRNPAVDSANAIIAAMNQGTVKALRHCDDFYRQSQGLPKAARVRADWTRRITVPMRGPRFIALRATETPFCGGAYPLNDHAAVVFDMTTGKLIEWQGFLAADASAASDTTGDGAKSAEITMPSSTSLALKRADPEGRSALGDSGDLVFQIWPDASRDELMIQANGQPHVTQGCEQIIGLSMTEAKKLGSAPTFSTSSNKRTVSKTPQGRNNRRSRSSDYRRRSFPRKLTARGKPKTTPNTPAARFTPQQAEDAFAVRTSMQMARHSTRR